LESADRSVLFKHGAKEIAYLNGWGLTFMAKPDHSWTGSSGHLHMSIWDKEGEEPLTHDEKAKLPYGMSRQFSQFVAGMMTLSRELAVFVAPFINSYKRYASLSWAPVNVVWGRDNRTTGFRLVGHGNALHIENPFPGGASGMGRVAARMFAAEGAKVVVADVTEPAARSVVDEVTAAGGQAVAVVADVSKEADAKRMVDEAVAAYGRVDVLYNNAGIM